MTLCNHSEKGEPRKFSVTTVVATPSLSQHLPAPAFISPYHAIPWFLATVEGLVERGTVEQESAVFARAGMMTRPALLTPRPSPPFVCRSLFSFQLDVLHELRNSEIIGISNYPSVSYHFINLSVSRSLIVCHSN